MPISSETLPLRKITFVVPALNEETRVQATINEIIAAAIAPDSQLNNYEIVIVDDGSTDQTLAVIQQIANSNERISTISHPVNLGLGAAYKSGLSAAQHPYIMLIPGDNSFPSSSITPIIACIGNADIVVPFHINADTARNVSRRFISNVFTYLSNLVSGFTLPYYNGIVIHRVDLIRSANIQTNGFAYQLEGLVKLLQQGHSFTTIGVTLIERQGGESNALRWRNLLQVIQVFLRLAKSRVWN